MAFPINCGLSERITFRTSNCAQKGSFCDFPGSQAAGTLHLGVGCTCVHCQSCWEPAGMFNRPWALSHCRDRRRAWGSWFNAIAECFSPLISQSTRTVPLTDSAYFILCLKIRKVKDLSCSLVILSSWGFVQWVLFSLCSSLRFCQLCLFWMHGMGFVLTWLLFFH